MKMTNKRTIIGLLGVLVITQCLNYYCFIGLERTQPVSSFGFQETTNNKLNTSSLENKFSFFENQISKYENQQQNFTSTNSNKALSFFSNHSTYLGGNNVDYTLCVAVDGEGNIVVAGRTSSTNFPTVNAYQSTYGGGDYDVFVTKFSADGQSLIFSTYFGGSGDDGSWDVAVDSIGNIIITGYTGSVNFPTLNAYDPLINGTTDAFIAKFSADGQTLLFSTYFGGSSVEEGWNVAIDATDNIVITGYTGSTNFPTVNAYQGSKEGGEDAFIAKFSADGQTLLFSTFIGGNANDQGWRVAINETGSIVVTGITSSINFPTVNAYQEIKRSGLDVFVAQFGSDGQTLIFSTFLGGNEDDYTQGVGFDALGNIVVSGITFSSNFPTKNAYQESKNSRGDAYITKFYTGDQSLVFSTFLGGYGDDFAYGIAFDKNNNILFTGHTSSPDFPTVNASQENHAGGGSEFEDALVVKLSADGQSLIFSTYLGGSDDDYGL
ncbi:MAG: SBBP repeat-containing protein, partial [Candidatus Hermodarchaeota archaeon]